MRTIHFGKILPIFPVIKNTIKRIVFENAYESSIIFQPLLYANVPAESPSYGPTFFVDNTPIMDYKESAIETRRESLIKKINHLICSVSGSRAIPIKGNIQYELSSRNRCFTAAKSDRYSA